MKRSFKSIFSIILGICLVLAAAMPAFASDTQVQTQSGIALSPENSYPYVFVHGMMGWGENAEASNGNPYWGFKAENNIPAYLRSLGYEVCVPTVGPMSSAWDRACELYAQLTGTVVDYGAAHSKEHGHSRYGRDYTGRPVMEGGWDAETPINLISHSFGGPAISIFASVMEYGCQEEIDACDDCSEFFKGGKPGVVYSVNTLASPHNGSPIANLLYDIRVPVFLAAFIMNIANMKLGTDYMFDQFSITKDPATGETATFNPAGIMALYKSNDHCAYDMTIKGARELNAKYPVAKNTYYFSYSGDITEDGLLGRKVSNESGANILGVSAGLVCACAGKFIGGEWLGKEWAPNDGLVPVVSARYPFGKDYVEYTDGTEIQKGIWNVMPTVEGASHGYHVSGSHLPSFYEGLIALVESL
ncbi:MAG: hypothetical protein MJ177_05485 [Clostridia bacterium]|nr:hypothetical protein [Clostridia bacterium]